MSSSDQQPVAASVEEMILNHPQAMQQVSRHWLAAALGIVPLLLVVLAVHLQWLPQPLATEDAGPVPLPILLAVVAHGVLCLVLLGFFLAGGRSLREDQGSDRARLEQIVRYLSSRRLWVLVLSWAGQLVVLLAGLFGLMFAGAPWLLLPLVPSFLLISISLRQPPTVQRLCTHVRSLRTLQQHRELL